jgi:phage recombination protein Bet
MDNVTALAPRAPVMEWTAEQRDLIKRTVAPEATNDELAMFLHIAAKAGLDPLQKQVWFVKRSGRVAIQAGVDGLQARALRMPDCEGITSAVVYEKEDFIFDKAKGEVIRHQSNPFGAQGQLVGAWGIVRRKGKTPFVALIRYSEYADSNSPLWRSKPAVMLEKVARSTALRRAYPEDFGGIYDPAEMGKDASPEAMKAIEGEVVEPHALPAAGRVEVPPTEAARNVTVAAEVLGGKVEPAPKPSVLAPHVLALWGRWLRTHAGNKKLAQMGWDKAAAAVFGDAPVASSKWSVEQTKLVEAELYPEDVK